VGHPGTSRSRNKQENESKSDKKMVNSVIDKWVKGPWTNYSRCNRHNTGYRELFYIGKCKFKLKISTEFVI